MPFVLFMRIVRKKHIRLCIQLLNFVVFNNYINSVDFFYNI